MKFREEGLNRFKKLGGEGMFFRKITTRKNGKEYVYLKLIENIRTNGKMKQRVVANFGSLDNLPPTRIQDLMLSLKKLYKEVELQDHKKADIAPLRAKIPGIQAKLLQHTAVQKISQSLPKEQQPVLLALLTKAMIAGDSQEPIQKICQELGLVEASSITFYNLVKKLGQDQMKPYLLPHHFSNSSAQYNLPIYIYPLQSIFQGTTFDVDVSQTVFLPEDFCKPFTLLLACDGSSFPLSYSLVEGTTNLGERLKELTQLLAPVSGGDIIVMDSTGSLEQGDVPCAVAKPVEGNQKCDEHGRVYFNSVHLTQKSEEKVKEIRANLAKAVAGLENIKADILLGKLSKEPSIRKKVDVVLKSLDCEDIITYYFNDTTQSLEYQIKEGALQEKTHSVVTTTWAVAKDQIKEAQFLQTVQIKNDRFYVLTDQLNIPPINLYADYHYSPDILAGHVATEVLKKQIAMVAKIPQQGGDSQIN